MTAPDSRDNPVTQNDPTQALFSALGRFCRHFTRAQSMPNGPWPEECMQELTASLRVCLNQNWTSLQQALIDTARVLSSYDRAGRAIECLSFLQKSHDILSLMVGDLILDRVTDLGRYGWPDHYARAVAALREHGIELIEDDGPGAGLDADEQTAPPEPASVVREPGTPFDGPPPMRSAHGAAPVPEMPLPEEPELSVAPEPDPVKVETAPPAEKTEARVAAETPAAKVTAAAEPETAPKPPAVPVQPVDESVEALNVAMQQAIMGGDVAQAKTLAIRLAAALARREIDTAQGNLAAARERLDLNGAAIEEGEHRVSDAESRVQHAEAEISAREDESQVCRERISLLDEEIHARKAEVADLDAQIQGLQERRAQEAATLHERESERAASVAGESLIQTEIESLNEEEDAAREFLESARVRLDTMRAERIRIEDEIAAVCADVERRKRSVLAIERPLYGDAEETPEETEAEAAAETALKDVTETGTEQEEKPETVTADAPDEDSEDEPSGDGKDDELLF